MQDYSWVMLHLTGTMSNIERTAHLNRRRKFKTTEIAEILRQMRFFNYHSNSDLSFVLSIELPRYSTNSSPLILIPQNYTQLWKSTRLPRPNRSSIDLRWIRSLKCRPSSSELAIIIQDHWLPIKPGRQSFVMGFRNDFHRYDNGNIS